MPRSFLDWVAACVGLQCGEQDIDDALVDILLVCIFLWIYLCAPPPTNYPNDSSWATSTKTKKKKKGKTSCATGM